MATRQKTLTADQLSALEDVLGFELPTDFHAEINVRRYSAAKGLDMSARRIVIRRIAAKSVRKDLGVASVGQLVDRPMPA